MRPIHVLLGLIVVLASGAAAYVGARLAPASASPTSETIAMQSPATSSDTSKDAAALEARRNHDEIAMLGAQVDALKSELESLRSAANRAPVASSATPLVEPAAAGKVTEIDRQTVLAVLEENRQREAAEAAAQQAKAEAENAKRRAARIAKELNLSPGDEGRLADLMVESRKKGQEMFESMRNGGGGDREAMRTQFETFRTWQTDQYTAAFGASIAEQIMQSEGGDRFFGGGPGAGGFAGGGNGQQQGGRGGRRANATGAAGGVGAPGGGQTQN